MSQARLRPGRRGWRSGGRVKTFDFSPGRLEAMTLTVWRVPSAGGLLRAKLTGRAYVACGMGNVHHPEVEIECAGHPANDDSASMIAALQGDEDAATELADELEEAALADWFDPCAAEGIYDDEEE